MPFCDSHIAQQQKVAAAAAVDFIFTNWVPKSTGVEFPTTANRTIEILNAQISQPRQWKTT